VTCDRARSSCIEVLLRRHLQPTFGPLPLAKIAPAGVGPVTVAKSYRLLRTILGTAVAGELLPRNPWVLPGSGTERAPEPNLVIYIDNPLYSRHVERRANRRSVA
jgi:hypothetical protein